MKSGLKEILSSVPVEQWRTQSKIIVDWYDGPLEGVCVLSYPECAFYFKLVGDWYNPDGLDDRIFYVSEFPDLTPEQFQELQACGSQVLTQYSEDFDVEKEQKITAILESRGKPTLIVRTETMTDFKAIWRLVPQEYSY